MKRSAPLSLGINRTLHTSIHVTRVSSCLYSGMRQGTHAPEHGGPLSQPYVPQICSNRLFIPSSYLEDIPSAKEDYHHNEAEGSVEAAKYELEPCSCEVVRDRTGEQQRDMMWTCPYSIPKSQ